MFDIEVTSLFEGDPKKIIFPFATREEAIEEIKRRYKNVNGWELDQNKYYKNLFHYDWEGNPSYEIRVRSD